MVKFEGDTNTFIEYVVEGLKGTSDILETYLDEGESEGYDVDEIEDAVKSELFVCTHCGCWYSISDEENGVCLDCIDIIHEEEDYDY